MPDLLILEDDTEQAELLAQILQREGYGVVIAPTADEAMEIVGLRRFDLIIADIFIRQGGVLVGNGGLRLIGFIRNGRRITAKSTPYDVPIIAVSGVLGGPSDMHFLKMARNIGADLHMAKPLYPPDLCDAIERLIAPAAPRREGT